ncbi:MAG: MBL fold metallo-hydrolase [Candidatus Helarchaeota archaeon]|nr:MBL fold metallo-hydrolase [Candidatus Helarchaeota archaeon]
MSHKIKKIEVVKPGTIVRTETGAILRASSTVTLVQSDENNILIDTSSKKDRDLLLQGLGEQGLTPNDIDIILITHQHRDHIGNYELFTSARIYTHSLCTRIPESVKIQSFPFSLTQNIEFIETPGHSWDAITVIVKMDKTTYAITGDAIPIKSNYDNWIPPIVHVDAKRALESMKKIVQIADIIIPGHDAPFTIKNTK